MSTAKKLRKARIQYELQVRDISQGDIAQAAGVLASTVSKVIAGTYPDATAEGRATIARVLAVIAEQTGLTELTDGAERASAVA